MAIQEERFAAHNPDEAVLQIDPPLPDRLDLGAPEGDPCFVAVKELVLMPGLPVRGDNGHLSDPSNYSLPGRGFEPR